MKPRRKHPGVGIILESPQGRQFIRAMAPYTNFDFDYQPLASTKDGAHIFALEGPHPCVLISTREKPFGVYWEHHWAFRAPLGDGVVFEAILTAYRWDPWLAAAATGDRTLIDGSPARRRRITSERVAADSPGMDTLTCRWVPESEASDPLLGVPLDNIHRALEQAATEPALPPA